MDDYMVCEDRDAYNDVVFIGSMDECLDYMSSHTSEYRMFITEWRDPSD